MNDSNPACPGPAAPERAPVRRRCGVFAALLALAAAPAAGADLVQCLIEPAARVTLRSSIPAQIVGVHVDRGSVVKKGQLLVTLDASVEKAALATANYRAVMQGQLKAAESKLMNAQHKF